MMGKTRDLIERVQNIPDSRRHTNNRKHHLVDILVSAFCAILANNDTFVEIALWAKEHQDFLRTFLELPNGIPSHDTYPCVRPRSARSLTASADRLVATTPRRAGRHGPCGWQNHAWHTL